MEVICTITFVGEFKWPKFVKPERFPKKGEIFIVTNKVRIGNKFYYQLENYHKFCFFDSNQFDCIENLNIEITQALNAPTPKKENIICLFIKEYWKKILFILYVIYFVYISIKACI